jgi:hypothetical protein
MAIPYSGASMLLSVKPIDNDSFNSPNIRKMTVKEQLEQNQQPLGSTFKSYELTAASNFYTLDPFQYSITKFKYNMDTSPTNPGEGLNKAVVGQYDFQNDPGLVYKNVDFERLLPAYTSTKKSVNDFPAQSYHRFEANQGYFNPNESKDNSDLWFYGADQIAMRNDSKVAGAPLNVQELNHIIFPEPQRGGLNSRQVSKYSTVNTVPKKNESWESQNERPVNNNINCEFFNYNSNLQVPFDKVYSFDSDYCRSINIAGPFEGSMPFNPKKIN